VQNVFIQGDIFQLDFAARSDRGLVRKSNQDVARVVPGLGLALVADGMGGHAHGELASRMAADAFEQSLGRVGGSGAHIGETVERLQNAFREANQRVADHPESGQGAAQMGTTLVTAIFAHGRVVIGNVGDSRCYRLRDGILEALTEDHSYAAQLQRLGATTTSEELDLAERWAHILTRFIDDEDIAVDTRTLRCRPDDTYLLCSDGLWGTVPEDEIGRLLGAASDADEACEMLVGAAWAGGGLDNIGVAVVRLLLLQLQLDDPSWADEQHIEGIGIETSPDAP
jgi:PPM family protein phosphatase